MSGALYGRLWSVTIGKPNDPKSAVYGNEDQTGTPLRVAFEIEKTVKSSTNKAKITIFNLANKSRQAMKHGMTISVRAGYIGLCQTLFIGNVAKVVSETAGSEIHTKIEAGDGEAALSLGVFNKSYPRNTQLATILGDIGKALSVTTAQDPTAISAGIAVGIPSRVYSNGFVAHGSVRETLNKMLRRDGLEWSIQNGALNIIPISAHNGRLAELISAQTGLVGIPSKNGDLVKINCLLNPRLVPGGLFQLSSAATELNGFYKVRKAKFDGDTHDAKWNVEIEGVRMTNVKQILKPAVGFQYQPAVVLS